jgi:hypothetical protein
MERYTVNAAEQRILMHISEIETALGQCLNEAAGEPMGFVLLVVPVGRVGEHIVTTNIAEKGVAARFMRDAAKMMRDRWKYCQDQAKRAIN